MRPDRFPKVNDVVLAEALRQLLPVAQEGVRALRTMNAYMPLTRAHLMLEMWVRQERGRAKKLGGELPSQRGLGVKDLSEDPNNPDPGQIIPEECERPKRPRSKKVVGPSI
jgi:hypothetical protein